MSIETTAYPEYVENEYTETMWVRADLAATGDEAIAYIVRELGLNPEDAYDQQSVERVHMRLYPPDHPDAPAEAVAEGSDYFMPEPESKHTVAYWQMTP